MKLQLVIFSLFALMALGSCSDDKESPTGNLVIEYENGKWTPQNLNLYDVSAPYKVVREIKTTDFKEVEVSLSVGKYTIKEKNGESELTVTIPSGKTLRVRYSRNGLTLLN